MTTHISGKYLGNKKVKLTHTDSGAEITTDAPKDNNGEGSLFSPTDLFAASLGTCMVTVMSIFAERRSINIEKCTFELTKEMTQNPRRIGKLNVTIHLPQSLTEDERNYLEKAAKGCPVHHSLHPEIAVAANFLYDL
jgi:putative redox protein